MDDANASAEADKPPSLLPPAPVPLAVPVSGSAPSPSVAASDPPPRAVVLLADVGAHKTGAVLLASPAVSASLGDRARDATESEREIGGPNLKTLDSL